MTQARTYLSAAAPRPRAAFFEFTSCEGCQLQLLNDEQRLPAFLELLDIVAFREAMSGGSDDYDIAFVEGSISCEEEIERLQAIRGKAAVLVALGSCACFGGVNQQRNRFEGSGPARQVVYGDAAIPATPLPRVLPLESVVSVDERIYGCPIHKGEVERIVTDLVVGKPLRQPQYPVCLECSAAGHICLFDLGEACLGPVTRGGCQAWCPASRSGCQGCRGPAPAANPAELERLFARRAIPQNVLLEYLECHGGFSEWAERLRSGGTLTGEEREAS